jgi:ribonuclease D
MKMPDANWIDRSDQLPALARSLESQQWIGVDTEFLRERTFFPKLCLLQLAAGGEIWCVDTLRVGSLEPLMTALTRGSTRKLLHAARQDLEAVYLTSKGIVSPVFDTQIAAACIGLKPQIGYAELVKTLLDVALPKGQTRTDWSKRPLTPEQLQYAADDVRYLADVAAALSDQLAKLNRMHWVIEDCRALAQPELYEPDLSKSWQRLRGIAQLPPKSRGFAKAIAIWRERLARDRDLPRAWILDDAALFAIAQAAPESKAALDAVKPLNERFAASLLEALASAAQAEPTDLEPAADLRPTAEQKALIERLNKVVDARAQELKVSAEVLAPRGEIKAIALGDRDTSAFQGWRAGEIGAALLTALEAA